MIPSFSDLFKAARAAYEWISIPITNYTLQKKISVAVAGVSKSYAYLSIKNPIKKSIRIRSVKIRIMKSKVVCPCLEKQNSRPDEKLGTFSIQLDGHSTAEWEIPYQVIGAGEDPQEIIIEYETPRRSVKEKIQDPRPILWAIKDVQVPDSAKNCITSDFEGTLMFDNKEHFPAAMGSARKNLFNNTNYCFTLNGTGIAIENKTNRSIEIASVYFVKDNHRIRAYLDKDYPQKNFVAGKTLRNQDSDIWIIPKDAFPLDQGRRHVEITFRMSIGEESIVDRIDKLI
jgi:hypothetical protein